MFEYDLTTGLTESADLLDADAALMESLIYSAIKMAW